MEKFSQFRDRGSGIAPFIPVKTPRSTMSTLLHAALFCFRLPIFIGYAAVYFLFVQHLPLPAALRKLMLWCFMAIPGIWWIDLQLDGVRRGTLADQPPDRIPHPGSIIACNYTSPIDALYLAAIFDPIFTISYPRTRQLQRVSLFQAILYALSPVRLAPRVSSSSGLTDLDAIMRASPDRAVVVFPECTTTNGRGILPFSPSLLTAPADVPVFPVSIRYTPPDVTTPVPGRWLPFLWDLLSHPTICLRVRIAERTFNKAGVGAAVSAAGVAAAPVSLKGTNGNGAGAGGTRLAPSEQRVLDHVAEALARLGRSKRVGLMLEDKMAFVDAWHGKKKLR